MAETESRNARKVRTGTVVSISGEKTITVEITYRKHHPKYGKMMTIGKKLHVHDEKNEAALGDKVALWRPVLCLRPSVGVSLRSLNVLSK